MASRRTKSIGTQVTCDEYARILALAGEQPISEWVRAALLKAAEPQASESVILAELLALRTILLNLHFTVCRGAAVTAETMRRLIERADQEKLHQARRHVSVRRAGGNHESSVGPSGCSRKMAARSACLVRERDRHRRRQRHRGLAGPSDVRLDTAAAVLSLRLRAQCAGQLARHSDRAISRSDDGKPSREPARH